MVATPAHPTPSSPPPQRPGRMNPLNWVLLVFGVLITALGLAAAIGGALLMAADSAQRDGRFLSGSAETFQSTGYAVSTSASLEASAEPGLPAPEDLATLRVRAAAVVPDQEVFVGIAPTAEVRAYLADVPHAVLDHLSWGQRSGQWTWSPGTDATMRELSGDRFPAAPGEQDFWTVSVSGTGTQEITFDLQAGQWTLVVMNADATRPVWIELQPGVRTELLGPVNPGLLVGGIIGLLIGIVLLLSGTAGLGRDISRTSSPARGLAARPLDAVPGDGDDRTPYPLRFVGFLDARLSRGMWLIKWLMAIPHYIVLALLWFALVVTTIAAGVAILFTGRYPRSWFAFSVGVLRWNWRVGFYAYSALGTDRYPPFTLAQADYPAALEVDYPEHLSRGLVLVKWWLLALPHLLIVGILTGSGGLIGIGSIRNSTGWGVSLLGLLVLIAAVALLVTGRYRTGLFDLIVGLNRWVYRVSAYVLLLRDDYPPFRLDQGPVDPPVDQAGRRDDQGFQDRQDLDRP